MDHLNKRRKKMTSVAELLKEYSKETAELQNDSEVTPEDPVEVIEDTVEVFEELEEGEEVSNEGREIVTAIDSLLSAELSFEHSVNFLDTLLNDGKSLDETAVNFFNSQIVESLEARGIPAEFIVGDSVFSAEADDKDKDEAKKEGFFTKIWNMIKAAFQRLREWISRFIGWFRKSGAAVKKAGEKLKAAAAEKISKNAKAPDGADIYVNNFMDLSVKGVIDPNKAVTSVREYAAKVLLSAGMFTSTSKKIVDEMNAAVGKTGFLNWLSSFLPKARKDYVATLSKMVKDPQLSALPGGRTVTFELSEKKGDYKVKVRVVEEDLKYTADKKTQPIPSLQELEKLGGSIVTLADTVEKISKDYESKSGTWEIKIPEFKENPEGNAEEVRELQRLISQGNAVSQKLIGTMPKIVFPIAKRAYVYGMISVRKYK